MLPELGLFALILALILAVVQAVMPMVGAKLKQPLLSTTAIYASLLQGSCLLLSFSVLMWSFYQNDFSVQLLTRQWSIYDSLAVKREVKGRGVVGEQPILLPGESYRYQSYCDLRSDIGWMEGAYLFRKEDSEELIEVIIPRFEMAASSKVN